MSFFHKVQQRVERCNSLLCIGLDPHIGQLKEPSPKSAIDFCTAIVNQTHPYAAAFKPNSAFFEQFGAEGFAALKEVISAIPADIPIILDCKRGDIDSTAQAYAIAAYDTFAADSVTLSPYMGWDSVKPFVTGKFADKGAFVLCKTSNPSANNLQLEKTSDGSFLYEKIASLCDQWNKDLVDLGAEHAKLGLVAGATDLDALQRIRAISPTAWILCPGVGAQGGESEKVCSVALRADGSGLLVSVSRGISKSVDMAKAAQLLRDEINILRDQKIASTADVIGQMRNAEGGRKSAASIDLKEYQKTFLQFAISQRVLQFGSFKLKSGRTSPYFFNAGLFSGGCSMAQLGNCYAQAIKDSAIEFDVIFGPAYKGIPLGTAVAMSWYHIYGENKEVSYNRKEAKDHGEGGLLVGAAVKGKRVLIVDDVITAGTAIREAVSLLQRQEANIVAVAVCLDRQEKTSESSTQSAIQEVESEYGFPVLSIVRLNHLIQFVQSSVSSGDAAHDVKLEDIVAYRMHYGVDY